MQKFTWITFLKETLKINIVKIFSSLIHREMECIINYLNSSFNVLFFKIIALKPLHYYSNQLVSKT